MNLNPFSDEFDCGCQDRKENMGAGEWRTDAGIIAGAVILAVIVSIVLSKK